MEDADHDAILKLVGKFDTLTCRIDNLAVCVEKCQKQRDIVYVTRREFKPVQQVTYGGVAIALSYLIVHIATKVLG